MHNTPVNDSELGAMESGTNRAMRSQTGPNMRLVSDLSVSALS